MPPLNTWSRLLRSENWKSAFLVAFLATLMGVFTSVAWELYKSTSRLELTLNERAQIFEKQIALNELRVFYQDEELDQIARLDFTLSNAGRTVIKTDDVVSPVKIFFDTPSDILDFHVGTLIPQNLEVEMSYDSEVGELAVALPLMNPGDRLTFSVFSKNEGVGYRAEARIAGIPNLSMLEDLDSNRYSNRLNWAASASLLFLGFSGVLYIAVGTTILADFISLRNAKKNLGSGILQSRVHFKDGEIVMPSSDFRFLDKRERLILAKIAKESSQKELDPKDAVMPYIKDIIEGEDLKEYWQAVVLLWFLAIGVFVLIYENVALVNEGRLLL